MLLKIDNRERTIIPALETACSQIESVMLYVENMELGDAGIYDDDGTELVLFERKSLTDLAASIKDGRYAEQSLRLSAQPLANHNVVYIIEGSIEQYNHKRNSIHYKTLMSAMVSLNYFKGFSVVRSWSILETIDVIMSYVAKIYKTKPKNRKGFYCRSTVDVKQSQSQSQSTEENVETNNETIKVNMTERLNEIKTVENDDVINYVSVIKRTKKENVTINNILAIMLCQIPGVSTISAEAISAHYPTMEELVQACKEGKPAFDKLRHKTSNRRLSLQCINNVITYVLGANKNKSQTTGTEINVDVDVEN